MPPAKSKAPAPAPAGPLQPTTAGGGTVDWLAQQNNQVKIGDEMLEHLAVSNPETAAPWGKRFNSIPEEHAARQLLWEFAATFLINVYIIPEGRVHAGCHLGFKTAMGIWSGWINLTRKRLKESTNPSTMVRACAHPACAR